MAKAKKDSKLKVVGTKSSKSTGKESKRPMLATEGAKLLGCSMALMYQMKRDGRLKTGFVKGKRLYFDTDEIKKLHASGEVHPRKQHQSMGIGDLVSTYSPEARFDITVPTVQYNILSMMLAPKNLSVAQWCTQMIESTVAEAQQSMNKNVAAAGGRR